MVGDAWQDAPVTRALPETGLFELLRTVRSRRVGAGYRVDSGETEPHPVTGRPMTQAAGPRPFISELPPQPLSDVEEALLLWAACGPNGLVTWEASVGAGFDQLTEVRGRTAPEANNTHATQLLLVNDSGVFLYSPPDEPLGPGGIAAEALLDTILHWYRDGRVRILDHRPDIDWAMRRAGEPDVPLHGSHQYNLNRPGSSWIIPLTDAAKLMSGIIDTFGGRHLCITDEWHGNRPAGLESFLRPGMLERPLPISAHEQGILITSAYPAGCMVQNARLAAEALGLGAWCLSGYDDHLLFGAEPEVMRGLGFHVEPENARAPVATGRIKTFGIDGVFTSTYVPSPRHPHAASLVAQWREDQFGPDGWAHPGGALLRGPRSPWPADIAQRIGDDPAARPQEWAWEAAQAYIEYCVATFGQWPVTYDPMLAGFSVVVHHVDTDFYDRHHRPGYVTDRIRGHGAAWH
jgi:hypothetical protein